MIERSPSSSEKRMLFLVLFYLGSLFYFAVVGGELLSTATGERWIPQPGGIQWAFLGVLAFLLVTVKLIGDEVFPPTQAEEEWRPGRRSAEMPGAQGTGEGMLSS